MTDSVASLQAAILALSPPDLAILLASVRSALTGAAPAFDDKAEEAKAPTLTQEIASTASADLAAIEDRVENIENYLQTFAAWCEQNFSSGVSALSKVEGDVHAALVSAEVRAASLKSVVVTHVGSAEQKIEAIASHLGIDEAITTIEGVVKKL